MGVLIYVIEPLRLREKYHRPYKISKPYHPQSNGQAELVNREIKKILEKIVNSTRIDQSL